MGSVGGVAVVAGAVESETVSVAASLLLDEMEPDVRLNITLPAGTGNGARLPRVLWMHASDDELPGPQQKEKSF